MRSCPSALCAVAVSALVLGVSTPAQAQVATFSVIRDAVPLKFFDAATSRASSANRNDLLIGFNVGFDPATATTNDFKASTASFSNRYASDTISFEVTAPAGYYVARLTYTQQGSASTSRTAVQRGTLYWTVAGYPRKLGEFSSTPNLTGTVDLSKLLKRTVPVSITESLFAAATGSISVTSAHVLAVLARLP
jgi:hypothetical protein